MVASLAFEIEKWQLFSTIAASLDSISSLFLLSGISNCVFDENCNLKFPVCPQYCYQTFSEIFLSDKKAKVSGQYSKYIFTNKFKMEAMFSNFGYFHVTEKILKHLDSKSLYHLSMVSQSLAISIRNPKIWWGKFQDHLVSSFENTKSQNCIAIWKKLKYFTGEK